jgi:hypothetical protein
MFAPALPWNADGHLLHGPSRSAQYNRTGPFGFVVNVVHSNLHDFCGPGLADRQSGRAAGQEGP